MCMVKAYNEEYPEMSGSGASSVHKFIKMSLRLRRKGIKLKVGSYFSFYYLILLAEAVKRRGGKRSRVSYFFVCQTLVDLSVLIN